jgi:peptidoglycan/xylan/chitin deacetylase (PgdA/CDA1 family)
MALEIPIEPRDGSVVDADYYRHERYLHRTSRSRVLNAYYAVKPLLPRQLQLALRRAYAPKQASRSFPRWPCEPVLVEAWYAELRARIAANDGAPVALLAPWPRGHRFASVLTHDVEGPAGVENIERVLEVERRHGFVSSWNFVAEWYEIPAGTFGRIRDAGCEIGLHAIKHDGKLFGSRARFDAELPVIHEYLERWGAEGFRSPATGRNAEWMHELGCGYDSSFPDSDPFEPQSGGCCSIWPFFFGDVVELPITLVQDHTLFEILRHPSNDLWERKTRWLKRHHGLVNLIAHPDYLVSDERLARYEAFLIFLNQHREDGWFALPRDVARWWRAREDMRCIPGDAGARIEGSEGHPAQVAWARLEGDEVVIDV